MIWIRTASERDLPAIQALLRETWHAAYDAIYGVEKVNDITREWHSMESLKARLVRPFSEFVVAEGDAGIIGMAFASQSEPEVVMLHQLYVHPDAQRRGAGSQLLEEIMQAFPQARSIRLEVEAQNAPAIGFYMAKGFAETGGTQDCGKEQSGIPALLMEKTI